MQKTKGIALPSAPTDRKGQYGGENKGNSPEITENHYQLEKMRLLARKHVILEGLQVARLKVLHLIDIELVHQAQAALESLVSVIGGRRNPVLISQLGKNQRGNLTASLILAVHTVIYRRGDHWRAINQKCLPALNTLTLTQLRDQKNNHIAKIAAGR